MKLPRRHFQAPPPNHPGNRDLGDDKYCVRAFYAFCWWDSWSCISYWLFPVCLLGQQPQRWKMPVLGDNPLWGYSNFKGNLHCTEYCRSYWTYFVKLNIGVFCKKKTNKQVNKFSAQEHISISEWLMLSTVSIKLTKSTNGRSEIRIRPRVSSRRYGNVEMTNRWTISKHQRSHSTATYTSCSLVW